MSEPKGAPTSRPPYSCRLDGVNENSSDPLLQEVQAAEEGLESELVGYSRFSPSTL